MKFINQLHEVPNLKYTPMRMLKGVEINDHLLFSIQASRNHYCAPRETLEDLSEYTSMEFALVASNGDLLNVSDIAPNFPKINEINKYFEGSVYAYVPVQLIDELYQHLTIPKVTS